MAGYRQKGESISTPKRLFVTDLDGTLLNDHKQIAPQDLAALVRMRQMGVSIALATGRSDYSFAKLLENLTSDPAGGLPADHIIFSTGAGIMDFPGGRLLKSYALAPEEVRIVARGLDYLSLDYMIHQPVPDTRSFLYRCRSGENPDFHQEIGV